MHTFRPVMKQNRRSTACGHSDLRIVSQVRLQSLGAVNPTRSLLADRVVGLCPLDGGELDCAETLPRRTC